jgi:hypothetical protein
MGSGVRFSKLGRAAAAADNAIPTLGARHTGSEAESSPPNSCGAGAVPGCTASPTGTGESSPACPSKRLECVRACSQAPVPAHGELSVLRACLRRGKWERVMVKPVNLN